MAISAYDAQIKPIAVGAMLVGAFYTLFKMRKSLFTGISRSFADVKKARSGGEAETIRTDKDLPFPSIIMAIIALIIPMVILYNVFTKNISSALVSAVVMIIMGLLFAAVAGSISWPRVDASTSGPAVGLTNTRPVDASTPRGLSLATGWHTWPGTSTRSRSIPPSIVCRRQRWSTGGVTRSANASA